MERYICNVNGLAPHATSSSAPAPNPHLYVTAGSGPSEIAAVGKGPKDEAINVGRAP